VHEVGDAPRLAVRQEVTGSLHDYELRACNLGGQPPRRSRPDDPIGAPGRDRRRDRDRIEAALELG
jgi:hypothetical protein